MSLRESLALLCEREIARKDERRIEMAIGLTRFPFVRDLSGFDVAAQPSIDRAQVRDLAGGRFIANGETVLLLGPPGVGKTHVSIAAPDPRPRGKSVGGLCGWPGDVIAARVRHRRAGAGPSLRSLPGNGAAGVIQQ